MWRKVAMARRSSLASSPRELGRLDGDAHRLFLEQRHAQGLVRIALSSFAVAVFRERVFDLRPRAWRGASGRGAPCCPGSARAGRSPPRSPGRRICAASAAAACSSAPGSRPGTRRANSPLQQHVVDVRVLARNGRELVCDRPCARAIRSKHLRMPVSMPSASTSTFIMLSASMSSLSHSMKVRSSIAALPIGTVCRAGPGSARSRRRAATDGAGSRSARRPVRWRGGSSGCSASRPACLTCSSVEATRPSCPRPCRPAPR